MPKKSKALGHQFYRSLETSVGSVVQSIDVMNDNKFGFGVSVRSCLRGVGCISSGYNYGFIAPHLDITEIMPSQDHLTWSNLYEVTEAFSTLTPALARMDADLKQFALPWFDEQIRWLEENQEVLNDILQSYEVTTEDYTRIRLHYDAFFFRRDTAEVFFPANSAAV